MKIMKGKRKEPLLYVVQPKVKPSESNMQEFSYTRKTKEEKKLEQKENEIFCDENLETKKLEDEQVKNVHGGEEIAVSDSEKKEEHIEPIKEASEKVEVVEDVEVNTNEEEVRGANDKEQYKEGNEEVSEDKKANKEDDELASLMKDNHVKTHNQARIEIQTSSFLDLDVESKIKYLMTLPRYFTKPVIELKIDNKIYIGMIYSCDNETNKLTLMLTNNYRTVELNIDQIKYLKIISL
ncbi:spore coat CotO family protein [Bacillus shivajii]|uniref:CotO family spore coat protein n=1 Tax=Bacillus shivajii TaxID=1983719 RepID=UPI001CFA016C|nr:CotO family spore coat protein [Bacillus shivajii]UCZ51937.1 spore coat CotO family protein [Bacillus shivajii]